MSTTITDLDGLARAIESRDAEAQIAAYTEDAILENIDAEHPPSSPVILHGRAEIAAMLRDVTRRDMEHRVTEAFVAGDKGALRVDCRYPDGTQVACLATLELRDGLIARQRQVQTWDS